MFGRKKKGKGKKGGKPVKGAGPNGSTDQGTIVLPNDGTGARSVMRNNRRVEGLGEMARSIARRKDDDPRVLSSRYGDVRLLEDDYKAIRGLIGALRQEGDRAAAKEFMRRCFVEVQAARSRKEPDDVVLLATLGATSDGRGGHWVPVSLPGG